MTQSKDRPTEILFRPLTEGLGFHPFSDGLPYAPLVKGPKFSTSHGSGATAAGSPRMALPQTPALDRRGSSRPVPQISVPVVKREAVSVSPPMDTPWEPSRGYLFKRSVAFFMDIALCIVCYLAFLRGYVWEKESTQDLLAN